MLGATTPGRTDDRTQNLIMQARKLCPPEYQPVVSDIVNKCPNVESLRHIIAAEGIRPCSNKVRAIRDFPRLRNSKEVAGFLGVAGYCCKFIKGFGEIARPLDALKKQRVLNWGVEEESAYKHLKAALTSHEFLAYPRFDCPFLVTTDASSVAIGGVVSQ
ncbi:uncharacterized protein [Palaemon carinicauda]|uniref:uncharacterized protein n=1 Tax=Palaemon carinicauda TaxID=392227 RepID=UPI0035B610DC